MEVFNQAGSSLESNKVPIDLSYDNIAPVPKGPFGRDIGSSNCFSSFCTMCAYIDDNSEITTLKYYLSNLKNLTSIDWDNIKPVEKTQGIYTNVQNYPYCLFDIVYYEENCP